MDPLRPERQRPSQYLARACYAVLTAEPQSGGVRSVLASRYPDDKVTPEILSRAAVDAAGTTAPAWAGALASTAVADFIRTLGPDSAAARLIEAGVRVEMGRNNSVTVPHRATAPVGDMAWIVEHGPIPVRQAALASATLGPPGKLAAIATLTSELVQRGGEDVLTQVLREDAALSLDAGVFSTAAASAARPAGILNGVTALTATAGGGDAAMRADLRALAAALVPSAPTQVVFVTAPAQALYADLAPEAVRPAIWPSAALTPGTVVAINPAAFVSGFDANPRIERVSEATLHFQDANPLAIGTTGAPATAAAPTRSLFQGDLVGIRLVLTAAWAKRGPGAVSFLTGATWG